MESNDNILIIESIKRYIESDSNSIAMLPCLYSAIYEKIKMGYPLDGVSGIELEFALDNFINIYKKMYYEFKLLEKDEKEKYFYTDKDNLNKNQLIPATRDKENIVDTEDIVKVKVGEDVPYFDITKYKRLFDIEGKYPYEILISPFTKIVKQHDKKAEYQLVRDTFSEITPEELEDLREKVLQSIEGSFDVMEEYIDAEDRWKEWKKKARIADKEDKAYVTRYLDRYESEFREYDNLVREYKENLEKLLKGLMKKQEDDIYEYVDKQIVKQKKSSVFKILKQCTDIKMSLLDLETRIYSSYKALVDNEVYYKTIAKKLKVPFRSNVGRTTIAIKALAIKNNIHDIVDRIDLGFISQDAKVEDIMDRAEEIERISKGLKESIKLLDKKENKSIVLDYKKEAEKQFNQNLYFTIEALNKSYQEKEFLKKRNELAKEKTGFFDKLLGKADYKNSKIANYNLKIQIVRNEKLLLEKNEDPEGHKEFKFNDVVASLYDAKVNIFDNQLPEELDMIFEELLNINLDGERYTEERLKELISERKAEKDKKLPVPIDEVKKVRFFEKYKKETEKIKAENVELKRMYKYREDGEKVSKIGTPEAVDRFENILAMVIYNIFSKELTDTRNEEDIKEKVDSLLDAKEKETKKVKAKVN
jgi:hypothetical protein